MYGKGILMEKERGREMRRGGKFFIAEKTERERKGRVREGNRRCVCVGNSDGTGERKEEERGSGKREKRRQGCFNGTKSRKKKGRGRGRGKGEVEGREEGRESGL